MAISLEELKRQREQIQKHLDWIDSKIAALEQVTEMTKAKQRPLIVEPLETAKEQKIATPAHTQPDVTVAETSLEAAVRRIPDIDASTYKDKTQAEVIRAKIGCFVLFILGIALFLFLLFGLPYLI